MNVSLIVNEAEIIFLIPVKQAHCLKMLSLFGAVATLIV